jgi:glycosyltransferase involved in cell wall biosynthesis
MRSVYLVNVSFGAAGTERRFANLWHAFRARGRVRPVMVIPESQRAALVKGGALTPEADPDVWVVPELAWRHALLALVRHTPARAAGAPLRTRLTVPAFHRLWNRILADPGSVMHIGLPCTPLVPPDMPLVYECMDSTLGDLGRGHYRRASRRPCIVNCQSGRILDGLRAAWSGHAVRWELEMSPSYFARYLDPAACADGNRDPSRILFVGRLNPEKSPLEFLDALSMLRDRGKAYDASILGAGPMLAAVEARIRARSLEDHVKVGHVPDVTAALARASVFVSLQTGDNYGSQALLEAMGAGCAVVASDVGETWRLVDAAVGHRVALEPTAIADAIGALLDDPARARSLGAAASRRAREAFSAERYAEFLEGMYERARERFAAARGS